ncbi:hypothetical protein D9619_001271 [Psilocybe cf. subviscida]|uniref:Uncharacterized protein n=1 Tax=Psilocybe cf. subviscida TaxID=2480587 RepID=A0A8H5BF42_9AGAR|nr:hypothetical protein D9619_001271 [Psilocybe cf. subviscida]
MYNLPPGIVYLLERAHKLLGPPALTYGLIRYFGLALPRWQMIAALLLSLPGALTIAVWWDEVSVRLQAARRGAVLPPRIGDVVPGGFRNLFTMIMNKDNYPVDGLEDKCIQLGSFTFNRRILFENRIITSEPDYIKAILATQFDDFEKGPEIRHVFNPLLGTGVFAADGELWKFHRSMTRPFFSKDRISHFDNFDKHADIALQKLKHRLSEGHPVDFQDLVARFTLDSATEFLFGSDVKSLDGDLEYPHCVSGSNSGNTLESKDPAAQFIAAFGKAQDITSSRLRLGMHWPLMEFWKDKIKQPMKVVNDFIDPIVAQAIHSKREAERLGLLKKDQDDETLLENLVNSTEDPITLRDGIMSLLVAGRDTTASTLTFAIYMFSQHPEVLKKLRQEILDKVGPHNRPTYDNFRDMKYLRAVINETLRLYPVVPFNVRTSKQATVWPNPKGKPFFIPANTRSGYTVFMMHRRRDLWGPDDRFLDHRLHKYLTPHPFIFMPFNAGPRICLGQQFAYHEASFFLVRLLQSFSGITLVPDAQHPKDRVPALWAEDQKKSSKRKKIEKIRPKIHLTMYVQGGLWIKMDEAINQ